MGEKVCGRKTAGLFGVPESPEREKKKSFLARIGDMQKIPQKARNDRNGA
jgi:hypothetical protein